VLKQNAEVWTSPCVPNVRSLFARAGAENVLNRHKAKKDTVFWDVPPCTSVKVHPRIGGTYCLRRQVRRVSQTRNRRESQYNVPTALTVSRLLTILCILERTFHGTSWLLFTSTLKMETNCYSLINIRPYSGIFCLQNMLLDLACGLRVRSLGRSSGAVAAAALWMDGREGGLRTLRHIHSLQSPSQWRPVNPLGIRLRKTVFVYFMTISTSDLGIEW
jgi:hypothetical protein